MDSRELMIGNYFNVPNPQQCPFRVDGIEFLGYDENTGRSHGKVAQYPIFNDNKKKYDVHPLTWELSDLSPIPLTEDILIRCGFEKGQHKFILSVDDIFDIEMFQGAIYVCMNDDSILAPKIKHLHDLQNLIFALTKQKITLK